MAEKIVRIGAGSGGLIDSPLGIIQHLQSATPPDYVIFDHMAEGMMSQYLSSQQAASAEGGFSTTFISMHIGPYLEQIMAKGVKIITNAGGLNPHGLARALKAFAETKGLKVRIGVVSGDDLRPMMGDLAREGVREMFNGREWPEKMLAANAYLGGFPIANALDRGADIVITGRVVDSGLALGPLIHEFGWGREAYDQLAFGTLIGHLLECGAQSSGGTFTDWLEVPEHDNIGFPYAECRADGSFVMTKHEGTGGLVSVGTVAEQTLYEVSDPAAYLVPDVACDFTGLNLKEIGPNRVEVTGCVGRAPTGAYKACGVSDEGWKASGLMPVFGHEAVLKARKVAESVIGRARRIVEAQGLPDARMVHYDLIGAGEQMANGPPVNAPPREVIARLIVHADDPRTAQIYAFETGTPCLNGSPGSLPFSMSGGVSPFHLLFCFTIPRDRLRPEVTVDGETVVMDAESPTPAPGPKRPAPPVDTTPAGLCDATVPLIALAYGRSGDKGNLFNVGVIARKPEYLKYIRAAMTPEAVGDWMQHVFDDREGRRVTRFEVPGMNAVNFVLHETQGGYGSGKRFDMASKSMGQQVLQFPIPVPSDLARRFDGTKIRELAPKEPA